jgi:NADH dehydrogenase (ubiquinone) 1 alpha subcomplex subunit 6
MPRVLTIYDIDIPIPKARQVIRGMMEENAYVRDPRVIEMLIEKGYMELEETLLHYKQRPHLMKILKQHEIPVSGPNRKRLTPNSSIEEQFNRA